MPKKILIVDDEEDMRFYLETLLRKAGYNTDVAINGAEALIKIEQDIPDLITLDILMPKKSGLNFFETLRSRADTKGLPIVIVSGISGNREFFEQGKPSEPTVFMEKPIIREEFLKNIKELLGE
ncbi:MAG: response regulator [Candidatus Hatepunaea meridiana]|nr:response regulator [Candidatus Hatepunaea meridiana]